MTVTDASLRSWLLAAGTAGGWFDANPWASSLALAATWAGESIRA
ncbi:hypothetical protein [Gordonia crocea]|nr:hypothetical protein [Gordonia crocea]